MSESFADAGSSWIDRVLTEGSGLSKGTEMHSGSPGPGPDSGENRSSESGQMPTAHPLHSPGYKTNSRFFPVVRGGPLKNGLIWPRLAHRSQQTSGAGEVTRKINDPERDLNSFFSLSLSLPEPEGKDRQVTFIYWQ